MPIFGRYEVVETLHSGKAATVSRARPVDGKNVAFVVKLFQPRVEEPTALRTEIEAFLTNARLQQTLGKPPLHWAPIHALGKVRDGAFYVSDFFPASLQSIVQSQPLLSSRALYHVVRSIVTGLRELAAPGRAHGNLTLPNVLLTSPKVEDAHIVLTDMAPADIAEQSGEAGDLHALGQIIHLLATHEHAPDDPASIELSSSWKHLGRNEDRWRRLCVDLLMPQADATSGHLDELAAVVEKLGGKAGRPKKPAPPRRPPRARSGGNWLIRLGVAAIVVCTALALYAYNVQRQLCAIKQAWLDNFVAAASQPDRLQKYLKDPTLAKVIEDANFAAQPRIPCSNKLTDLRPQEFMQLRNRLIAAQGLAEELAPDHWDLAATLRDAQSRCQSAGWTQPAAFLASRIADLKPGVSSNLSAAIDEALALRPILDKQLPLLLENWKDLDARTHQLQTQIDPYPAAFGNALRSSAVASLQLTPAGFKGEATVKENAELARNVQDVLRTGYPNNISLERFRADVASHISLTNTTPQDVRRWLEKEPLYVRQDAATARSTEQLQDALHRTLNDIADVHPDADDLAAIDKERNLVEHDLTAFSQTPFITRDISDGTFTSQRTKVETEISALLEHVHRNDPRGYLRSLPVLATRSDVINAYWEDWKHVLQGSAAEMSQRNDLFASFRRKTDALRKALANLDNAFPAPPENLSPPFAKAARSRRERDISQLLASLSPSEDDPPMTGQTAAANAYKRWLERLQSLAKDFPIRSDPVTLNDAPDEAWQKADPDFWNDISIQELVKPDLTRLARVRAVRSQSRPELIDTASDPKTGEVAFAAWQMLGGPGVKPPWPTLPGELQIERDLRDKLAAWSQTLKDDAGRKLVVGQLSSEGVARWRRAVESAQTEPQLQQAIELQNAFGNPADLQKDLSAPARFNIALYLGRQRLAGDDQATAAVIASLARAARDLKDQQPAERLLARLARIDVKEKFSDANPGNQFSLQVPGSPTPFIFQRVEPSNDRPFYLCTTTVSVGQFVGVIQAANAWETAAAFNWGAKPDARERRKGPRSWEWVPGASPRMTNPLLWLYPDDANDYLSDYRIDRFNRTALSDDVGGNPSPNHPMQYISAEAALFFAAKCGCRLPTAAEWRDAYAIFERTVAPERWNLRDQTWARQQQYAALQDSANSQSLDADIFLPDDARAAGATSKARETSDGTLFFRKVDAAGGGTFHHLIGNVWQILCEKPEAFDAWQNTATVDGIRSFVEQQKTALQIIGGSALSPPGLPLDSPLPLTRSDLGYSDVGLRLAFNAPAKSLAERLNWALSGQSYLWTAPSPTTRPAQ